MRNVAKIELVVTNQKYVIRRIKNDVIRRIKHIVSQTERPYTRGWIERLILGRTG